MSSTDYGSAKSVSSVSASSSSSGSGSGSCPEYVTLVLDPVPWSDGYSDCFASSMVLNRTVDNGNCVCFYEYHDMCQMAGSEAKLDISWGNGYLHIKVSAPNGLGGWTQVCYMTAGANPIPPHSTTNTCWSGILEGFWGGPPHRPGIDDWYPITGTACPGVRYFAIVW